MAWVMGDPVAASNGVYGKVGASGSWTRRADLPFSFIIASDAGAGTPNAIQATTSVPVSGSSLVWLNIAATNTGSPVSVSFNGGAALTIKTNSGNDVVAGGLVSGIIVMGIVSGPTFRLVSDQASAAIITAAEGWASIAQAAANGNLTFITRNAASSAMIDASIHSITLKGDASEGDSLGGLFVDTEKGSTDTFESEDGRTWYRAPDVGPQRLHGATIDFLRESLVKPILMPFNRRLFRRKVALRLSIICPDEAAILAGSPGATYSYPSAMTIDEVAGQLIIVSTLNVGTAVWHKVYRWNPGGGNHGDYLFSVKAGSTVPQGAHVSYEGGTRYLYTKNASPNVGKYAFPTNPTNLSTLSLSSSVDMDLNYNICGRNGVLTTENFATNHGSNTRQRHRFTRRNLDGSIIDRFDIGALHASVSGYWIDKIPKQQTMAEGPGFYAFNYGGHWDGAAPVTPYMYCGTKLFVPGTQDPIATSLMNPAGVKAILNAKGVSSIRSEGEGIHVMNDGTIYSLFVVDAMEADLNIVIFEEFSEAPDAIDFANAAVTWSHPSKADRAVQLSRSGNVTLAVASTTPQKIPFQSTVMTDYAGYYDAANDVIRPLPGMHMFYGAVEVANPSDNELLQIYLYRNGASMQRGEKFFANTTGGQTVEFAPTIIDCSGNDTFDFRLEASSATGKTINGSAAITRVGCFAV
ncbi:hypothetical protein M0654_11290 [Rhizobium sp. NTR19]|uniref:Uncharacterized protein n=1 Tax=Neorhizobium turbinariae TaxID=2937795 RepID=A0ABT0IRR5_9HYPH|nr:hypothetical protein [Neorhizobium turbinariae]MCK8780570.1 hypothetical protein [Neorhizobium turbinariae]